MSFSLSNRVTLAFARLLQKQEMEIPYTIHEVSRISSDLRGSDRCRFDLLGSSCVGTKCLADLQVRLRPTPWLTGLGSRG
jgi:hypothetical protein